MPRTNNKKKKNKSRGGSVRQSHAAATSARNSAGGTQPQYGGDGGADFSASLGQFDERNRLNRDDIPEWDDFGRDESTRLEALPMNQPLESAYSRYKDATERFKKNLQALVPSSIWDGTVNCIMEAAEYVANHSVPVSGRMLRDLKLSLRVRKRVTNSVYYGRGDEGHSHFISVLNYCWSVLRPFQKEHQKHQSSGGKRKQKQQQNNHNEQLQNRFQALALEEDFTDDSEDDEADLPKAGSFKKPVLEDSISRLSLEELMQADDRHDAILFLTALDEMMAHNADQFTKLKEFWHTCRVGGNPPLIIIEHLMETAIAANMSIQQVQVMEQRLHMEYEHMNTCYRMFSVLILPKLSKELTEIITNHSPRAAEFKERDASAFLGDCLECGFRNKSDPDNREALLADEFAAKWQVPKELVPNYMLEVSKLVLLEAPMKQESAMNSDLLGLAESLGLESRKWLPHSRFIGNDRSIVHTIRLLQCLHPVARSNNGLLKLKQGFFGKQWDEKSKRARTIHTDLDELLMGDILPSLISMCWHGLLSSEMPFEEELLTMFFHMKKFFNQPGAKVSWALAFSIHTLLTSIYEVQGSEDLMRLAETARNSHFVFFKQLEWVAEVPTSNPKPAHWKSNLHKLQTLSLLVKPPLEVSESCELKAVWNPFCAGAFMSYFTYFGNLNGGTAMVDSFAQLRIVLHLYNAFRQVGIILPGQLEVLDWLYDVFGSSKAIWEGQKPTKGSFVLRWWIVYGMSIDDARRMSNGAVLPNSSPRKMTPINPEDVAKSFGRICLRDFRGVVDRYHTEEQQKDNKGSDFYAHAVRVNDTLDAMDLDERLLATNLTRLGETLDQFLESLLRILESVPTARAKIPDIPVPIDLGNDEFHFRRLRMVIIFSELILRCCDTSEHPLTEEIVVGSAGFMDKFFSKLTPGVIMYFSPVEWNAKNGQQ